MRHLIAPICMSLLLFPSVSNAAEPLTLTIESAELEVFEAKLDTFVKGLSPSERSAWGAVSRRAASLPAEPAADVKVSRTLTGLSNTKVRPTSKNTGRNDAASPLVIESIKRGTGLGIGTGPRPDPTGTKAIGPKQDDPKAIGPKQDDPSPPNPEALAASIQVFSNALTLNERGILDWVISRANRASGEVPRPGTPGGVVPLRQALALEVHAIGPKQDDPAPPAPGRVNRPVGVGAAQGKTVDGGNPGLTPPKGPRPMRWTLRF